MDIRDAAVLTCNGNEDTRIRAGGDYRAITWDEVLAMVLEPAAKPKTEAPAIIPSVVFHAELSRVFHREVSHL